MLRVNCLIGGTQWCHIYCYKLCYFLIIIIKIILFLMETLCLKCMHRWKVAGNTLIKLAETAGKGWSFSWQMGMKANKPPQKICHKFSEYVLELCLFFGSAKAVEEYMRCRLCNMSIIDCNSYIISRVYFSWTYWEYKQSKSWKPHGEAAVVNLCHGLGDEGGDRSMWYSSRRLHERV
jgi:hypothetical protein